jgi:radical SAM family uncharacterized protein/radical SAM-linked protein
MSLTSRTANPAVAPHASQGQPFPELAGLLPHVKNPGRYIGGEANQVVKDKQSVLADMLLLFPDLYELGMSHNGTKVLYHLINRESDLAAERAFAPMPDFAEQLKAAGKTLYSLESYRPARSFSAIGISLQTELNYTNVPYVLELSGLSAYADRRLQEDPFVIGGGPCMANPEPVAPFFDLFVIGDGEQLAPQLLREIGHGRQRGEARMDILARLTKLKGVYVPALMPTVVSPRGEQVPPFDGAASPYAKAKGVQRTWVEALNADDYPVRNLVPHMKLVHDRFSVEVMRGCTQGCRFCQAGYWYRPNRELHPDAVIDLAKAGMQATGERELGLLSLSTADYGQAEHVLDALIEDEEFLDVDLSLPSLRANSFGQGLATKAAALTGGKSATFAPETGSERLRKIINKTISDADMLQAAENVFSQGFHNIKLYTMVGLPTEDLDDMRDFCTLIEKLHAIGQKHGQRNTIHANIGILVPKPFTPMQWVPFMDEERAMRHIRYVRERFRKTSTVRITWADWGLAHLEAFYSRGDRDLAPLIYSAYQRGGIFESHSEFFRYDRWQDIWQETGFDQERIFGQRGLDEVFPWDYIHAGSTKGFLKLEYKKMYKVDAAPVPDCKWGECQKCGIPGNYLDISLAPNPEKHLAPAREPEAIQALAAERRAKYSGRHPYHLTYRKTGLARFIAHQNTMDLFEKAFRRLKLPLAMSTGFNPRPLIRNTGALPLGLETRQELLVVELRRMSELSEADICRQLSEAMPEGMDVIGFAPVTSTRVPRVTSITYRTGDWTQVPAAMLTEPRERAFEKAVERFQQGALRVSVDVRDRQVDLAEWVESVWMDQGELWLRIKAHESGAGISPYLVYGFLLQVDGEALRSTPIAKNEYGTKERE